MKRIFKKIPWEYLLCGCMLAGMLAAQITYWIGSSAQFRCPSIPAELLSHPYLEARQSGGCKRLSGQVHITYLFVNEDGNAWEEQEMQAALDNYAAQTALLTEQAAARGVELSFSHTDCVTACDSLIKMNDWTDGTDEALRGANLPSRWFLNLRLATRYNADSAFVVLCLRRESRSFAIQRTDLTDLDELLVLYGIPSDNMALLHEIMHLYGAEDFYTPDDAKTQATKLFGQSLMLDSDCAEIDPLTAYMVGWTDEADQTAIQFLQNTAHFTKEFLREEIEKDTFTGEVTDYEIGSHRYTGALESGTPHGEGTMYYADGGVYTGGWDNGRWHGHGKLTLSNGNVCEGEFVRGSCNGKGTYTYTNGDKYEGDFVNNKRTGYGVYTWANGDKYEGGWQDGERTGYGVSTVTNGNRFEGEWEHDRRNGNGTFIWANGDQYEGNWEDGERTGYGVYTWADGASHAGYWKENNRHGHGVYTSADGDVIEGEWVNDVRQ